MQAPHNEHDPTGMVLVLPLIMILLYSLPVTGWLVLR